MKIPLRYQVSEYDCGPTSLLNALNYLFQREEISPELIRNIMLYSLDCYGSGGAPGKRGTSRMAMMFLRYPCGRASPERRGGGTAVSGRGALCAAHRGKGGTRLPV